MKEALDGAPAIDPSLGWLWKAYLDLAQGRQATMAGVQPIAFSEIDRYARRFGPDRTDEFERFYRIIVALDSTHRDMIAEQRERDRRRRERNKSRA